MLFWQEDSQAQRIDRRFKNYSIEDGLSQSTILDIKQDANGLIWLATADGLNVFNGVSFEVYKKDPSNPQSISSNFVYSVLPLSNGKVWAITQDRIINEINPRTKVVNRLAILDDIQEDMYAAKQLMLDQEGNVWLSTYEQGVFILDENARVKKHLKVENNLLPSNTINQMFLFGDMVYVSTSNGVAVYKSGNIKPNIILAKRNIGAIFRHKNHLYISDYDRSSLYQYHTNDLSIPLDTLLEQQDILHISVSKNGTVWAGSLSEGIFEISQNKVNQYKHSPIDRWSLIDNNVFSMLEDDNQNIWIGTNSGLSIYKKAYNVFKLLRSHSNQNSLSSNKIYEIYEDNSNRLWFINYDGSLDMLDKFGVFKSYTPNKGAVSIRLRSICQIGPDEFILGSNNSGLFKFNAQFGSFKPIQIENYFPKEIRKIKYHKELIYIAHDNGIGTYSLDEKKFIPNIIKGRSFVAYDFLMESDEVLYIATFGSGLLKYNLKQNSLEQFKESDNYPGVIGNNVMCIVKLSNQQLALGTYGGGLSIYQPKNNSFRTFTESDGLRNNSVYGIIEDKKGNLWLSTNIGISKLSHDFSHIHNYDLPIQLQSLEFNEDAFLKSSKGIFYFGGVNGVNFFNPSDIIENTNSPKAVINEIYAENRRLDNLESTISLNSKENDLIFRINAKRISIPEKTTFKYKLEGLDNEWRTTEFTTKIEYNNLPPGEYTFKLIGCNEYGYCDETVQEMSITIRPPIYKTWWFLTLVILFIGLSVIAFFRYRTNNLRREYAAKMTNAELRALRTQMNPHFIFNSLNSIQYYVLNSDSKTAYKYLTKFSSLMRKTLQHSKENFLPLKDELKALALYLELENMRLEDTLDSQINLHNEIDSEKTLIPTLFLQPFVENAILHGLLPKEGERKISIDIEPLEKGFQCVITDNGIGRKASIELNKNRNRSHKSTALETITNRIKILNESGNVQISMEIIDLSVNDVAAGTQVVLKIV